MAVGDIVQSSGYMESSGTTVTVDGTTGQPTVWATPTSGNTLVALISSGGGAITDPSGWTKRHDAGTSNLHRYIYDKISDGTETSLTVTFASSESHALVLYEIEGEVTFDLAASAHDTSVTSVDSGETGSSSGLDSVALALGHHWSASDTAFSNGFTVDGDYDGGANGRLYFDGFGSKALVGTGNTSTTNSWTGTSDGHTTVGVWSIPAVSTVITFPDDTLQNVLTGTSITFAASDLTGIEADDYLMLVCTKDDNPVFNLPSGFTQAYQANKTGAGDDISVAMFYRKATSGEISSGNSEAVTVSWSDSEECSIGFGIVRGADQTTFDDAAPQTDTTSNDNSNTPQSPAITTVTDDAMVISLAGTRSDNVTTGATPPTGYTFWGSGTANVDWRLIRAGTSAGDSSQVFAWKEVASFGVETPGAWGGLQNARDYVTATFAIRPATPGTTVPIGEATETETAQPVVPVKPIIVPVGIPTEAETAQAVLPVKQIVVAIGTATESETAQPVVPVKPIIVPVGIPTEAETAQAVLPVKPINVPVGEATETETGQAITADKSSPIGEATETETAQPVVPVKPIFVPVGEATEVETPQPVVPVKPINVPVGEATETETAQPVIPAQSINVPVGEATETDTAQSIPAVKPIFVPVGTPAEVETPQPVVPVKPINVPVGEATEVETAQPVIPVKPIVVAVGTPTEVETPQPVLPVKPIFIPIGTPTEVETAQIVEADQASKYPIGTATETETAQPVAPVKPIIVAIGTVTETESGQAVLAVKPIMVPIGTVTETETAQPVIPVQSINVPVGEAMEVETAQPVVPIKPIFVPITAATEAETAQAVVASKPLVIPVGEATEVETAQSVAVTKPIIVPIGEATETETAKAVLVIKPITIAVGTAAETETAQLVLVIMGPLPAWWTPDAIDATADLIASVLAPIAYTPRKQTDP